VIHRFRDPRAGDAYALVLPTVVVGYRVLGDTIVVQAADIIRSQERPDSPTQPSRRPRVSHLWQSSASRGWRVSDNRTDRSGAEDGLPSHAMSTPEQPYPG
jgi:hypothetical protein